MLSFLPFLWSTRNTDAKRVVFNVNTFKGPSAN